MKKVFLFSLLIVLSWSIFGQEPNSGSTEPEITKWMLYLWCLAGCVLQEFIYWFELKHEIAKGNIPPALTSRGYWIITLLAIAIFSVASYFYFLYGEQGTANFFTTAVFAAGFARLFKGAVANVQAPEPPVEPANAQASPQPKKQDFTRKFSVKDYLMR